MTKSKDNMNWVDDFDFTLKGRPALVEQEQTDKKPPVEPIKKPAPKKTNDKK